MLLLDLLDLYSIAINESFLFAISVSHVQVEFHSEPRVTQDAAPNPATRNTSVRSLAGRRRFEYVFTRGDGFDCVCVGIKLSALYHAAPYVKREPELRFVTAATKIELSGSPVLSDDPRLITSAWVYAWCTWVVSPGRV